LDSFVRKNCPVVVGKLTDSVNLVDFEKKLKEYPYLESVDIVTNQGIVTVKAKQEKVIAKVFGTGEKRFYLAKSGNILPESPLAAGRVVVVNGHLSKEESPAKTEKNLDSLKNKKGYHSGIYTAWKIACYLDENEFWKSQIGQIYIDEMGDAKLIPTVGEQLIIFGKIRYCDNASQEVEQRFENLKNVYKGFKITGWNRYKTINLKFGSEIPCEKRE